MLLLAATREKGILHRDLKPAAILLQSITERSPCPAGGAGRGAEAPIGI